MELENQVCSLELAKKLKELGVKQESLWWWVEDKQFVENTQIVSLQHKIDYINTTGWNIYSAFTVAELFQIIYDKGLDCGIPNRLRPDIIPCYLANYLIMELQGELIKGVSDKQKEGKDV